MLPMSQQDSAESTAIEKLYRGLLDAWNRSSAKDFAAPFADDGSMVGFDGSQVDGRAEIEDNIGSIFKDHQVASYVGKVREVRFLTPETAILRAVAGMIPPGKTDLNPERNTIQTLVAVKQGQTWRIAMYHNTPAAWHGRPDDVKALTDELREMI
jgi:uncharacterized protein (TIGR02246 family)